MNVVKKVLIITITTLMISSCSYTSKNKMSQYINMGTLWTTKQPIAIDESFHEKAIQKFSELLKEMEKK